MRVQYKDENQYYTHPEFVPGNLYQIIDAGEDPRTGSLYLATEDNNLYDVSSGSRWTVTGLPGAPFGTSLGTPVRWRDVTAEYAIYPGIG